MTYSKFALSPDSFRDKSIAINSTTRLSCITLLWFILLCSNTVLQAQVKNYPAISGHRDSKVNPLSPDPIFNYKWDDLKADDGLESYQLRPVSWSTSEKASFDLKAYRTKNIISILGKGSIRFDFGRTNAGWLEFDSDDLIDSVAMSISEYNEPAIVNAGAVYPVKTSSPVKHGHTYRLELNPELYEGVRFGWLHMFSHRHNWHIRNLRLVCQVKPVNYQGSFSCSDAELTRIWYTGAYTVKLNLQKDYFGAILMERSDRHSWTGDAYPSQAASMVAFGNYDFVKKNIENTAGLNNDIASYSLYWVLSLIDYVNYTGDTVFARKYIDNASKKLDLAYDHFDSSPNLGFYGWDERLGTGFENPGIAEPRHAYAMLSIQAWHSFGLLMKQIGENDLANKYIQYAESKIQNERNKGQWLNEFGLHASADAINAGLTTPQEDSVFYNRNYTDRVNRLSYSPFNEFFIINAMAKMKKYDDAISSIKDCWGGQLRYGGTTFFEVYRPSWNTILAKNDAPPNNQCGYTSLTHPWSAGVVKWLSEEVLGIKPLKPGFQEFEIIPHLANGLTSVKGATPTLFGNISADFNLVSGITNISVPKGALAKQIAIPLDGSKVEEVFLNGKSIWNKKTSKTNPDLYIENDYIYVKNLVAGKYKFGIKYKTAYKKHAVKNTAWNYKINSFSQDSLTQGNWRGKYGKDGIMLFNYFNVGKHLQKLPTYIDSIVLKKGKNVNLDLSANKSILQDTMGLHKSLGAIITQDPIPCLQTMTIDIHAADSIDHQVALYFLDWDSNGRRSAVEIFDLKTLNLLSPVQLIKNYQHGKYLVFNYSGSIRVRINQVRGVNAAMSGLFFK